MVAHESTEGWAVSMMENMNLCTKHAHRKGITPADHTLQKRLIHEPWEEEYGRMSTYTKPVIGI
jgi:hypothetical protein